MKDISIRSHENIRRNDGKTNIPLIAYYSTDRFKKDLCVEADGSRLRGYYNALNPLTNIKFFLNLYYTETLSSLQYSKESQILEAVNEAVKKCIDYDKLIFDIKKQELLLLQSSSHEGIPFHLLSDGFRTMLTIVMEIAFRCFLLNLHLGKDAAQNTSGVVFN